MASAPGIGLEVPAHEQIADLQKLYLGSGTDNAGPDPDMTAWLSLLRISTKITRWTLSELPDC